MIHDDDAIIGTNTLEHHQKIILSIMITIQEAESKFNPEKLIFAKQQIVFWVLITSKSGVQLDLVKVDALHHVGILDNKEAVMSFSCMVHSLSNFIPNLSQKA